MHEFEVHFRVLELEQTATLDEIKQAYKDLVMVWHPDRFAQNVRLRHKAEAKLKQFNQAYACLKQWWADPQRVYNAPEQATSQAQERRSPRPAPAQSKPPPHVQSSGLYITYAHAHYVMGHYCFELLKATDPDHDEYQSGPFVLQVCHSPLALILSVPCYSLQEFDRILLTIPCKSTGHFYEAEAQQLLALLQTQVHASSK